MKFGEKNFGTKHSPGNGTGKRETAALFVSASRRRACWGRAARRSEPEVAFRFSPAAVQISRFAAAAFDRSEKNAGRLAGFFRRLASLRRESDYKRSQTGPEATQWDPRINSTPLRNK